MPEKEGKRVAVVALKDESVSVVGEDHLRLAFENARNHHQVLEISGPPGRPCALPRIVSSNHLQLLETDRQHRHRVHLLNALGIIEPTPVMHPQINFYK